MSKVDTNPMLILLLFFLLIFILPYIGPILGHAFGYILSPLIGFNGKYPILTIAFASFFVAVLSSFFNAIFTDWKAMGRAQEISKAFQREFSKAVKENDTEKIKKLKEIQPKILQMTTQQSLSTFKTILPLTIFIVPIFFWLWDFLSRTSYPFFSTPWTRVATLYDGLIAGHLQYWLLMYLILTTLFGQIMRQAFKMITLTEWWQNIKTRRKSAH